MRYLLPHSALLHSRLILARSSGRIVHQQKARGRKFRRLAGLLSGPVALTIGPVLLLSGHIGRLSAAVLIFGGLGAIARDLEKVAAKRRWLPTLVRPLHATSRLLFLSSELVHVDEFIFGRLLPSLFAPLVTSLRDERSSETAPRVNWETELEPRGNCWSCGHEIVTNVPRCPACDALLKDHGKPVGALQH